MDEHFARPRLKCGVINDPSQLDSSKLGHLLQLKPLSSITRRWARALLGSKATDGSDLSSPLSDCPAHPKERYRFTNTMCITCLSITRSPLEDPGSDPWRSAGTWLGMAKYELVGAKPQLADVSAKRARWTNKLPGKPCERLQRRFSHKGTERATAPRQNRSGQWRQGQSCPLKFLHDVIVDAGEGAAS